MLATCFGSIRAIQCYSIFLTVTLLSTCGAASAATTVTGLPSSEKPVERAIALTFDDAPKGDGPFFTGSERTTKLIEALHSVDARGAMFFVTTSHIDRAKAENVARLKAYAQAGHYLANHSHRHSWLWRTEVTDYLADIDIAQQTIASVAAPKPYFRFPYLDEGRSAEKRDALRDGLAKRGLSNGYVTVDNYDWYMDALAREAQKAGYPLDRELLGEVYVDVLLQAVRFYDDLSRQYLGRSVRHVLLLHENDLAALYIDDLVRVLRDEGWTIIEAPIAYQDPIAKLAPDTLFLGQGRVAAIAAEQGALPATLVHPMEDEQALRDLFVTRGLLPAPD